MAAKAEGREFLSAHGVYLDTASFLAALAPPQSPRLSQALRLDGTFPVATAQQPYLDYEPPVIAKIEALGAVAAAPLTAPFFLWLDTDTASSDRLMTSFAWPAATDGSAVRLISHARCRGRECRFLRLDAEGIERAQRRLASSSGVPSPRLAELLRRLRAAPSRFLAVVAIEHSEHLLEAVQGWTPRRVVLSDLLEMSWLITAMEEILNALPLVRTAMNEAIADLRRAGIEPHLAPRAEDWLPLRYACPADNRRLRLHLRHDDGERWAVARCSCGRDHRFRLGSRRLSMTSLAATGRWSPDVSWPIMLNREISGYVAGRSSALYGLVLRRVTAEVLGERPIPTLVPRALIGADPGNGPSLLRSYLEGASGGTESNRLEAPDDTLTSRWPAG